MPKNNYAAVLQKQREARDEEVRHHTPVWVDSHETIDP